MSLLIKFRRGVAAPIITECDGDYNYDARSSCLLWTLPLVNSDNSSGAIEFNVAGTPDDFFPVNVNFTSKKPYCDIKVR